jgi:hypothetical protein
MIGAERETIIIFNYLTEWRRTRIKRFGWTWLLPNSRQRIINKVSRDFRRSIPV